jgi:hypothetical protein
MLPRRGMIFIEKDIGERNRPRGILFQGENPLSDGTKSAFKKIVT